MAECLCVNYVTLFALHNLRNKCIHVKSDDKLNLEIDTPGAIRIPLNCTTYTTFFD